MNDTHFGRADSVIDPSLVKHSPWRSPASAIIATAIVTASLVGAIPIGRAGSGLGQARCRWIRRCR